MATQQFNFPREISDYHCRLNLRKYSRPNPNSDANVNIESSIRLPLPTNLTDSYNIDTNEEKLDLVGNFGRAGDIAAAGIDKLSQYKNEFSNSGFTLDLVKKIAVEVGAVVPGISDTKLGIAARQSAGFVRNPHLTTIFEGVKLKQYTFNWKLAARSPEEARDLENIIQHIKTYMHPELLTYGFALEYPYIADMEFVTGDSSLILPNVKRSFITRLDVNSMGSGVPAFFRDGRPVTVELTIGFQEINIQTRGDFINRSGATIPAEGSN